MKLSTEALAHVKPPGPEKRKVRMPGHYRIGAVMIDCGCPLAASPHTRDAHALASLQRDLPDLFPLSRTV